MGKDCYEKEDYCMVCGMPLRYNPSKHPQLCGNCVKYLKEGWENEKEIDPDNKAT